MKATVRLILFVTISHELSCKAVFFDRIFVFINTGHRVNVARVV